MTPHAVPHTSMLGTVLGFEINHNSNHCELASIISVLRWCFE